MEIIYFTIKSFIDCFTDRYYDSFSHPPSAPQAGQGREEKALNVRTAIHVVLL